MGGMDRSLRISLKRRRRGADTTPSAFAFTDQTDVAVSTVTTSAAVEPTGYAATAVISITGGEYDIDAAEAWASTPGTIDPGETVRVRHTSSASNSTATNTVLTIGGVSDTFTSTTIIAAPAAISDLTATAQSDTEVLLAFTAAPTATSHEYRVDAGSWVAMTGTPGSFLVDTGLTAATSYDFTVRGVNAGGNGNASNIATETTTALAAPVNTVAPVASGTAQVGETGSATDGTWTGYPTPTLTSQWYSNDANDYLTPTAITDEEAATYLFAVADEGRYAFRTTTGTNASGSDTGDSNILGPIIAAAAGGALTISVNDQDGDTLGQNPPNFYFSGTVAVGDSLTIRHGPDPTLVVATEETHSPVTSDDIADQQGINWATVGPDPVESGAGGPWYINIKRTHLGVDTPTSNIATDNLDVTATATPPATGLVLWREAKDLTTQFQAIAGTGAVANDGDVVGTWNDKSATAFHMTALADDTTRPTHKVDTGIRFVRFDGTNDYIRRAAELGLYDAVGATSGYAIRGTQASALSRIFFGEGSSSSTAPAYAIMGGTTNGAANNGGLIRNDASAVQVASNLSLGSNIWDGAWHTVIMTDTGSSISCYIDGVLATSSPDTYTRSGTLTLNLTGMGSYVRATPSNWCAGDLAADAHYTDVLDSTGIADLHTYLLSTIS